MLAEEIRRKISPGEGLGLFKDREPQKKRANLPAGTTIVSADNHYPFASDIYYDRFPAHLKDKAPRVWWDEKNRVNQVGFDGKTLIPHNAFKILNSIEDRDGCRSLPERMADLDAEGVAKEIVFPQNTPMFFNYPDFEAREWIFKVYNEYMSELHAGEPDRFFPVAIPNYWDPAKAPASIELIKRQGFKTFMLPMTAKETIDGKPVGYTNPEYDRMWAVAEEVGLPVCYHIGESFKVDAVNGTGGSILGQFGNSLLRRHLGDMIFGLILDKYPKLKIVFAEGGANWVAGALVDAELIANSHALTFDARPKERPSYYWHNNCYATFQVDPVGMRVLDIVGADRLMWAVDYPHNEGSFGYTQDSIEAVLQAMPADDARLVLGRTALDLFDIR